jgi:hypothetical protein
MPGEVLEIGEPLFRQLDGDRWEELCSDVEDSGDEWEEVSEDE